jgi:hypothetical protein
MARRQPAHSTAISCMGASRAPAAVHQLDRNAGVRQTCTKPDAHGSIWPLLNYGCRVHPGTGN